MANVDSGMAIRMSHARATSRAPPRQLLSQMVAAGWARPHNRPRRTTTSWGKQVFSARSGPLLALAVWVLVGGLAASGWHTAAVTMRLLVDSEFKPAGGILSLGFDELRRPRPVRPEDELRVESEVLEVRPSKSRQDHGLVKVRMTTLNRDGAAVRVATTNLLVARRPA
jgi:acyl dehydratase